MNTAAGAAPSSGRQARAPATSVHQRSASARIASSEANSRPRQNESRTSSIGRSTCGLSRGFRARAGSTKAPDIRYPEQEGCLQSDFFPQFPAGRVDVGFPVVNVAHWWGETEQKLSSLNQQQIPGLFDEDPPFVLSHGSIMVDSVAFPCSHVSPVRVGSFPAGSPV